MASRSASMLGAKRSWKLMAAARFRSRQMREDAAGVVEIAAHGLLDEDGGAFGHALDDGGNLAGRDGDVEDGAGRGERVIERGEDAVDGEVGGALRRGVGVDVEDAGDGEAERAVRGQVRVAHDAAGADDDDRARGAGAGPLLLEVEGDRRGRAWGQFMGSEESGREKRERRSGWVSG